MQLRINVVLHDRQYIPGAGQFMAPTAICAQFYSKEKSAYIQATIL